MTTPQQDFYLEGMTMLAMSRDPSIFDTVSPQVAALVYENKIVWNRLMLSPEKSRAKRESVPLVRTWRERAGLPTTFPLEFATPVERAMVEEIAELREVLEAILWPNRNRGAIDPRQMDIEDEQQKEATNEF